MLVTIDRFCYAPFATFGILRTEEFGCYTVERPWLDNKPFVSCIPHGHYHLVSTVFRGKYHTYEVEAVNGRDQIKFHVANWGHDLQGCIGLGKRLGLMDGEWCVTDSRETMEEYLDVLGRHRDPGAKHELAIRFSEGGDPVDATRDP